MARAVRVLGHDRADVDLRVGVLEPGVAEGLLVEVRPAVAAQQREAAVLGRPLVRHHHLAAEGELDGGDFLGGEPEALHDRVRTVHEQRRGTDGLGVHVAVEKRHGAVDVVVVRPGDLQETPRRLADARRVGVHRRDVAVGVVRHHLAGLVGLRDVLQLVRDEREAGAEVRVVHAVAEVAGPLGGLRLGAEDLLDHAELARRDAGDLLALGAQGRPGVDGRGDRLGRTAPPGDAGHEHREERGEGDREAPRGREGGTRLHRGGRAVVAEVGGDVGVGTRVGGVLERGVRHGVLLAVGRDGLWTRRVGGADLRQRNDTR